MGKSATIKINKKLKMYFTAQIKGNSGHDAFERIIYLS